MTAETLIRLLCWVGVAGLAAVGAAFLIAPQETLAVVDHTQDKLPQVMGGRYLFFGVMLAAVLRLKDRGLLAGLLLAFGGVGFIDAFIYWGENAFPHAVVGLVCVIAAMVLLRSRKGMS